MKKKSSYNIGVQVMDSRTKTFLALQPQTPQATVCCNVGAAALVHFRLGRPGPPARSFKKAVSRFLLVLDSHP